MNDELDFKHGDIAGAIAVTLANGQTLDDLCLNYIPEYSLERFEAIAIRVFVGKETVITIYALDKQKQEGQTETSEKLPVKKFKINTIPASELFSYCESFNFTLSTGVHHVEDMEVINK